jgi:hypothetical protein
MYSQGCKKKPCKNGGMYWENNNWNDPDRAVPAESAPCGVTSRRRIEENHPAVKGDG